jgi:glycosyltransferase involved in cell wall biosynthesis
MISKNQPLVSVLTPVYNEEYYLSRCIESVLSQTYKNWEYIIVNNCSTDKTLDIAKKYAQLDSRIRVCTNDVFISGIENFNMALSKISPKSKYIKIVGGDDWIYDDCLQHMVALAERNPSVALVGSYWIYSEVNSDFHVPAPVGGAPSNAVVPGREMARTFLMGGPYQFGSPTSLLYRADVVRSRPKFFDERIEYADLAACLEVLDRHDFGFVPQILTFTRTREESLYARAKARGEQYYRILACLRTYGEKYLSEMELKQRTKYCHSIYYEYLGSRFYDSVDGEFWTFHYKNMRDLGINLSKIRLLSNAFIYAVEVMGRRLRHTVQ